MTILPIARAELTRQARSGQTRAASSVVVLLALIALASGARRHAEAVRARREAEATTYAQFVSQGNKNPHTGAHYGIVASRPESALAFFDPGGARGTGGSIFIEPHAPGRFRDPPGADEVVLARWGLTTAAEACQLLLPLLLLLMAAPVIAGERERGTLRLALAQGATPGDLLLGKALGIGAALALVLAPIVLVSVLLAAIGPLPLDPSRAAGLFVAYGVYLAAFLFACLGISARAATARGALVAALGLWGATVVIGPRLGGTIAQQIAPTPSALAFQEELERHTWGEELEAWDEREAKTKAALLKEHRVAREEDLPVNVEGLVFQAQEDDDAPAFDRAYGSLFATFAKQGRVLAICSIGAPQLAVQAASMAAAGTDTVHDVAFWWSVERYRRDLVRVVNDYATNTASHGAPLIAGRSLWEKVAPFEAPPPPARLAFSSAWSSLLVLVLWLVCAGLWAHRGAVRMEVGE